MTLLNVLITYDCREFRALYTASYLFLFTLVAAIAVRDHRDASTYSEIEPSMQASMKVEYATTRGSEVLFHEKFFIDAGWVFVKEDLRGQKEGHFAMRHRGVAHIKARLVWIPQSNIREFKEGEDKDPRPKHLQSKDGPAKYIVDSIAQAVFSDLVLVPEGTVFSDGDFLLEKPHPSKATERKFKYVLWMRQTGSAQHGTVWISDNYLTRQVQTATIVPFIVRGTTYHKTFAFLQEEFTEYGFQVPDDPGPEPVPRNKRLPTDRETAAIAAWTDRKTEFDAEQEKRKYIKIKAGSYLVVIGGPQEFGHDRQFRQVLFQSQLYWVPAIATRNVDEGAGWCCCEKDGGSGITLSTWKPETMCRAEEGEACRQATPKTLETQTWMDQYINCHTKF